MDKYGAGGTRQSRVNSSKLNDDQNFKAQTSFWNNWNSRTREKEVGEVSQDQADVICQRLGNLDRTDLNIIDVGCGSGWLCARLSNFGTVTGTDLSDEVLERAAVHQPNVKFVPGDFMALGFAEGSYDIVVALEVLSHVADQEAFVKKLTSLLRPGGFLMLATQNKPALQRNHISPPAPGQLRKWLDKNEVRSLLAPYVEIKELFSITPKFNRGILRIINAQKVRRCARAVGLTSFVEAMIKIEERAWLGWTLMALAQKPANA
jgi:2-polyprenyl-3-methyl-5-hydroxy-6-metoxy-1,4-benzoquinol methylase